MGDETEAARQSSTVRDSVAGATPRILLVDDQPARLLTYESILQGVGVECVRSLSGREALARLLHDRFALILLDVSMPDMDGFETARMIRQHPRFEQTPIIFVTGVHVTTIETLKGYEAGAIDYIPVPVVPEILRSKVSLLVELYRRRTELERLNRELSAARERLQAERDHAVAAARAQREIEREHAELLDISSDAIFVWELGGPIQYWNKGAEELYGFSSAEAVGKVSHDLLSTVHPGGISQVIEKLRCSGTWRGELIHQAKSGASLPVQSSMQIVRRNGRTLVMESNRDLRELKRNENLLREADRRKDEFLAMLSHELRNPLAPIRNVAEYLNRTNVQEKRLQWAQGVLNRQITHMTRILDDLLDVCRITRGQLIIKKQPIGLDDVVEAAMETARPLFEKQDHRLLVDLPSARIRLDGDPVRLAQAISNLLLNAAKYTDRGGMIQLLGRVDGAFLRLCVKDNGVGISPEHIPQLFTMFSQIESTYDRAEGGLGIGLALAKNIVELHGGTIEASSAGTGAGSEFQIRLPVEADRELPSA